MNHNDRIDEKNENSTKNETRIQNTKFINFLKNQ
jgi:hypothetical protein